MLSLSILKIEIVVFEKFSNDKDEFKIIIVSLFKFRKYFQYNLNRGKIFSKNREIKLK